MVLTDEDNWTCKCKCWSKQAHRARWAFISTFKKNKSCYSTKQNPKPKSNKVVKVISKVIKKNKLENKEIANNKIKITKSNLTKPNDNVITENVNKNVNKNINKVRYDQNLNKIVLIESEICTGLNPNPNSDVKNQQIIQEQNKKLCKLIDLRDLLK